MILPEHAILTEANIIQHFNLKYKYSHIVVMEMNNDVKYVFSAWWWDF